jgi:hypothetical protein
MSIFQYQVGDIVEWDSPSGYRVEEVNGIVVSHGTLSTVRRGVIMKIEDPAPERERLLAEGKYPLYGDWSNLRYLVESEGREYYLHPITHGMRLLECAHE